MRPNSIVILLVALLAPVASAATNMRPAVSDPALRISRAARIEVSTRDALVKLTDKIEPKTLKGLDGKKPSLLFAGLNLAEAAATWLGVMRPERTYSAWVDSGKLMRGSEQNQTGYTALRDQGVKTVINLRREDNSEAPVVKGLGMNAVHIPMFDQALPTPREIQRFLEVAEDPKNQPVYVHCEQGIGRTGVMVALYRIHHDGLSADAAVAEAKANGLNSKGQVEFIRDYAAAEARGARWTSDAR